MPAIRDYSFNYTTSTSGTTITIPLPAFEVGDLLIALLVADTGTGTWSAAGWSEYVRSTNTVQSTIMYKIATADDVDPTFTRSVQETFHGVIVSIKDVDTTTPFNNNSSKNTSLAVDNFPTLVTDRDNCLLLWFACNSAVAVPSVIVGPVVGLYGVDGTAESSGVGWGIQAKSGDTTSNVYVTSLSSSNQLLRTIAINAPSNGAIVIPSYCVADKSQYLNPLHGTTAYNGNTSAAQDPTTVFGTSLQGRTIVSDVATAAADYGLNPFHSTARITADGTTPVTWRGTRLDFSAVNKPNLTGKALIVHTGPSTPGQYQRIRNIAAPSGNGIAVAIASSAGNWKAWHLHGANTPFGFSRDVPLVIHPDNAVGIIGTAGSLDYGSVSSVGFFVSTISVSTSAWDFYSMWALDKITLCGGNSNFPMDIAGVVSSIQGHEHRGVIQQGRNQMIGYMPIQFGNTGINPIYLNLNSTAIEFGKIYSLDNKIVNFCSIDSFAGLEYCPGSGDTIKHTNSIVSSDSPYFWKIADGATGSPHATYDFAGLSIIGAKPCVLRNVTTFSNMSFSQCGQILATGVTLQDINIVASKSGEVSAIKISPSTSLTNIVLSTTNTGYYGIEIPISGSYNFDNVSFDGFGAGKSLYVSAPTGNVTVNVLNGGDVPTYTISGGSVANVSVLASASLILTGLQTGSEVRAYVGSHSNPDLVTEIAGVESSNTSFDITHSVPGSGGYIIVHALGYNPMIIDLTYSSSSQTIPVSQQIDRVYENPV